MENEKIVRSSIRNYARSAKEKCWYFFSLLTKFAEKRWSTIMIMIEPSKRGAKLAGGGGDETRFVPPLGAPLNGGFLTKYVVS